MRPRHGAGWQRRAGASAGRRVTHEVTRHSVLPQHYRRLARIRWGAV